MFKRFFAGLIVAIVALANITVDTVYANNSSAPIIIDNVLDLCENALKHNRSINDDGNCDAYSSTRLCIRQHCP